MQSARSSAQPSDVSGPAVVPGWYVGTLSRELNRGKVLPVVLGGRELVAYRTASGRAAVLDRYCRHLGASLALGSVEGEQIRCAFHRWSYDTDGLCRDIPACQKIPPHARVRSYPVTERFGAVWVFLGDRVYYDLPQEEDVFEPGHWWTTGLREVGIAGTMCRDIAENLFDFAHTLPVHEIEYDPESFEMSFEGPRLETRFYVNKAPLPRFLRVPLRALGLPYKVPLRTKITGRKFGPALSFYRSEPDGPFPACVNATMFQPIGPTTTRIFMAVWSPGGRAEVWKGLTPWLYHWIEKDGIVHDDLPIWNTKRTVVDDPVLSGADRWPIMRFRKWWAGLEELARAETSPRPDVPDRELAPRENAHEVPKGRFSWR